MIAWILIQTHAASLSRLLRRVASTNRFATAFFIPMVLLLFACNQPPVATEQAVTLDEDTHIELILEATDSDGKINEFLIVTQPSYGRLTQNQAKVSYVPNTDFFGIDSFWFRAQDNATAFSERTKVKIIVKPVNDPPVVPDIQLNFGKNNPPILPATVVPSATDVDSEIDAFEITREPNHGTVQLRAKEIRYAPRPGFDGVDSFEYVAVDTEGARSESAEVQVVIEKANAIPLAETISVSTSENQSVSVELLGRDTDGTIVSYEIIQQPQNGQFSGGGRSWTYEPAEGFRGRDSFMYRAVDNEGAHSKSALVDIVVSPRNISPTVANLQISTSENQPVLIHLAGEDPDGSIASYETTSNPQNGEITGAGAALTYSPKQDFHGHDVFSYRATDEKGAFSNTGMVSITVEQSIEAPIAKQSSWTVTEDGGPITILLTSDLPPESLREFRIESRPKRGSINGAGNTWQYTPERDFSGLDTFTFTVLDEANQESESAIVSINVLPQPDPPHVEVDEAHYTTNLDRSVKIDFDVEDPDQDATQFNVRENSRLDGNFSKRSGRVGTSNWIRYTPKEKGTHQFEIEVTDSTGLKHSVSVTVETVNAPPKFDRPQIRYDKNRGLVEFTLVVRDPDGRVRECLIETIDGRRAKEVSVHESNGPSQRFTSGEPHTFRPSGSCSSNAGQTCTMTVTYTPDLIDGHSRRIRFYAYDDQGDVSRKDYVRIETQQLQ